MKKVKTLEDITNTCDFNEIKNINKLVKIVLLNMSKIHV